MKTNKKMSIKAWNELSEMKFREMGGRILNDEEAYDNIKDCFMRLPYKERFAIEKTFWGNWTQERIGKKIGVSQPRVRQLLEQGFKHINEMAMKEGWRPQPHYAISSMYSTWDTTFSYSPDMLS